ncbi:MAG: hypothetical protein JXJ04_01270, partial [Spirochaetales bacterium]|nr:hypothetical protein [Spirochaetales bacterium]
RIVFLFGGFFRGIPVPMQGERSFLRLCPRLHYKLFHDMIKKQGFHPKSSLRPETQLSYHNNLSFNEVPSPTQKETALHSINRDYGIVISPSVVVNEIDQ